MPQTSTTVEYSTPSRHGTGIGNGSACGMGHPRTLSCNGVRGIGASCAVTRAHDTMVLSLRLWSAMLCLRSTASLDPHLGAFRIVYEDAAQMPCTSSNDRKEGL
jgi:hypothetical protein